MSEKRINIGPEDLSRMQIGENSRKLYWDGAPIRTETGLKLSVSQKIIGVIVALTTFAATATTTISNFEKNCLFGYGQICSVNVPPPEAKPADECGG